MNFYRLALASLTILLATGCVTAIIPRDGEMPRYVSPAKYASYNCEELKQVVVGTEVDIRLLNEYLMEQQATDAYYLPSDYRAEINDYEKTYNKAGILVIQGHQISACRVAIDRSCQVGRSILCVSDNGDTR